MALLDQDLRPRRAPRLTERHVGDEAVVVNAETDTATALDPTTTVVWQALDGATSIAEVAASTGLPADTVEAAVTNLLDAGLLVSNGMSRRTLLRRAGTVALVAPLVTIALPEASFPASTSPGGGTATISSETSTHLTGTNYTAGFTVNFSGFTTGPVTASVQVTQGSTVVGTSTGTSTGTSGSGSVATGSTAQVTKGMTYTAVATVTNGSQTATSAPFSFTA